MEHDHVIGTKNGATYTTAEYNADVAKKIQKSIGGTIHRMIPKINYDKATLGDRILPNGKTIATRWNFHEVVVKNGHVYDALTGPAGQTIEQFKNSWGGKYSEQYIIFGF